MSTFISTDATGAVVPTLTRPATVSDIFTTVVSSTDVITGANGFVQKLGLVALGAAVKTKQLRGTFNPLAK